jgi:hypothetical protein
MQTGLRPCYHSSCFQVGSTHSPSTRDPLLQHTCFQSSHGKLGTPYMHHIRITTTHQYTCRDCTCRDCCFIVDLLLIIVLAVIVALPCPHIMWAACLNFISFTPRNNLSRCTPWIYHVHQINQPLAPAGGELLQSSSKQEQISSYIQQHACMRCEYACNTVLSGRQR